MNGLLEVELSPPGFLARLLGRPPKENAFHEIRNRLATSAITDVPAGFIEEVLSRHRMTLADARPRFQEMYAVIVRHHASQGELTKATLANLRRLRDMLGLTDSDLRAVETEVYRTQLQRALGDQRLTDEEQSQLSDLAKQLRLPDDAAQVVQREELSAVFQRALKGALEDQRLSPEEDGQLQALAEALGVDLQYGAATRELLDRYRLFWRFDQAVLLKRGERCHFTMPATHCEIRTRTRAVGYSGPVARVKIMKGLYWRAGYVKAQRFTEDVLTALDEGTLYVTSHRLFFDGQRKGVTIPLGKIVNFTVYTDGVGIERDTGKDQFFKGAVDGELFAAILGAALRLSRQ